MTLTRNTQSWIAATAFVIVAILVVFDPLPEPTLTIVKSVFFWPAAIWMAWLLWSRRSELKDDASLNARSIVTPLAIVIGIAACLALARWAALSTGISS